MSDQQRLDTIGAFGNTIARTPNIDALAARGVRFDEAYSQHSACTQSRISMLTGWYPHVSGHRTLDNLLKPWEPNLLASMRSGGYYVAWPGVRGDTFAPGVTAASTDFFGYLVPPALDVVGAIHSAHFPPDHKLRHAHYVGRLDGQNLQTFDEAAVQTAIRLIADGLPEPFFLIVTLFSPHPPFAVEEPWYSMYDRADMPAPAPAGSGKPAFHAALRERAGLDALSPGEWAEIAATYYGMIARLDDQFGRVQAALDHAGVTERTVTVFGTDHGEYLGDYGLIEKWPSGVDACLVHNPLVIAGPGIAAGATHETFVEMIDLTPTLADLAEVELEHVHHGKSLVPVLTDPAEPHRHMAFSEGGFRLSEEVQNEAIADHPYDLKTSLLHERPELVGRTVAVRTENWTYVYRQHAPDELYDRTTDPAETINVAAHAQHATVAAALRGEVLDWLLDTSDVIPLARDPRIEPALLEQMLGTSQAPANPSRA